MRKVRFTKNWNQKLDCEYFTTIRKLSPNYYKKGQMYEIVLNGKTKCAAQLVWIQPIHIGREYSDSKLHPIDMYLDTGLSPEESEKLFQKMYGDKVSSMSFARLLFKTMGIPTKEASKRDSSLRTYDDYKEMSMWGCS